LSSEMNAMAVVVVSQTKALAVDDSPLADARQEVDGARKLRESTFASEHEIDEADIEKMHQADMAYLQEAYDSSDFQSAVFRVLDAGKNFDSAVKKLVELVRSELNHPEAAALAHFSEVVSLNHDETERHDVLVQGVEFDGAGSGGRG
jgi:hypothetical protein